MVQKQSKRNLNCDVLRIFAFILVILVHSLININFYGASNRGLTMLLLNLVRPIFMTCVPLFLILSGFLTKEPEFNKAYVLKLGKILFTYFLCAIVCLVCLHFLEHRELLLLRYYVFSILSFHAAPYGWYVDMYIGLYLLIPFLNRLWGGEKDKSLSNKKYKQNFILVLLFLFVLPSIFNIYDLTHLSSFFHHTSSKKFVQIVPDYWSSSGYPIMYYFLGRYLKEFKLKMKWKTNAFLIFIMTVVSGLFNFYRNYNHHFAWDIFDGMQSFQVMSLAVLIANLILNYKQIELKSAKLTKFINKLSVLTFGGYLVSRVFDVWLYNHVNATCSTIKEKVIYLLPVTIIVFCCSLILSYFIDLLSKYILKTMTQLKERVFKTKMSV